MCGDFVCVDLPKHVALCSYALSLRYIYDMHILGTHKAVWTVPSKLNPSPRDNERCGAMSKALLYRLMWCLSKQFSSPCDGSRWDNTRKSPGTHPGILLSPPTIAGGGNVARVLQTKPSMREADRLWVNKVGLFFVSFWLDTVPP